MKKVILIFLCSLTTSCSNSKIQMPENFNWDLDFKSIADIYPIKDDVDTALKYGIYTSDKNNTSFEHKDTALQLNTETKKLKYITFRNIASFKVIEKFTQSKHTVAYTCKSLSGTNSKDYYYGFINTTAGESRFSFKTNSDTNQGNLTITRPDTSVNDDEDTAEKRFKSVTEKCILKDI